MYVYTPGINVDRINRKLSEATGLVFSSEPIAGDYLALTLIFRKNALGGVDDPLPYISDPLRTVVIPGHDNEQGFAFADAAVAAGVPEDNLLFIPAGRGLSIQQMAQKITQIITEHPVNTMQEKPGYSNQGDAKRIKVIAVIGGRGGVGRTTITLSLASHYTDIKQTVAILDLGSPPAAYRHAGVELQEQEGFRFAQSPYCDIYAPPGPVWEFPTETIAQLINELRAKYRRVIVDFPTEIVAGHFEAINPDRVVVVMDPDVMQTVEPFAELKGQALFVYNKAVPDVDVTVINAFVGESLIIIENDIDGCQAGLTEGTPAYRTSETVARGIGELAGELDR